VDVLARACPSQTSNVGAWRHWEGSLFPLIIWPLISAELSDGSFFFGSLHRHRASRLTRMWVIHDMDLVSGAQASKTHPADFGKNGFQPIVVDFAIQISNVKVIAWIWLSSEGRELFETAERNISYMSMMIVE